MRRLRKDLDGLRIIDHKSNEVWLIINGMRHYINGSSVYDALFSDLNLAEAADLEDIVRGPNLGEGTCLVKSDDGSIYLISGEGEYIRKHRITTWETFNKYAFNFDAVKNVPKILLDAVPSSIDIFVEVD